MRAFLQALFGSLLEWLGEQAAKGKRAVDAREDRELQQRIGNKITEHLRARRGSVRDVYGSSGMSADGARERRQPDQDGA